MADIYHVVYVVVVIITVKRFILVRGTLVGVGIVVTLTGTVLMVVTLIVRIGRFLKGCNENLDYF